MLTRADLNRNGRAQQSVTFSPARDARTIAIISAMPPAYTGFSADNMARARCGRRARELHFPKRERTMGQSEILEAELRRIRLKYAQELPGKLAELKAIWDRVADRQNIGPDAVRDMLFLIHRLAGSGETFGYPEVSVAAQQIECELDHLAQAGAALTPERREKIGAMLDAFAQTALKPGRADG